MTTVQILGQSIAIFVGVVIGVLIAKFLDSKMCEKPNLYHFYFTCICVNAKGKRFYPSYKVELQHVYPSEEEIENLKHNILVANPEYKECAILSVIRLGVSSGRNQNS